MNSLQYLRKNLSLTQVEAANILGISRRTYQNYESMIHESNRYKQLVKLLEEYCLIDENHGVLAYQIIVTKVKDILKKYDVNFCYLFGSYAKNKATDTSDIDLLIDTSVTGLKFFGIIEELRESLCKKIDLLDINQIINNKTLLQEILKDGIKIYG